MRTIRFFTLTSILAISGIACSKDPNVTRQQAANATEQIKQDSREAAGNIKKGAETARTEITAAAQGVKEGLSDKGSSEVNLNTANKAALMGLPGINEARANAIIADRPYQHPHDIVSKRAITEDEFQKIASQVSTHPSAK
jgi:DNA uptake protein ComE-like DNA-binding protein